MENTTHFLNLTILIICVVIVLLQIYVLTSH